MPRSGPFIKKGKNGRWAVGRDVSILFDCKGHQNKKNLAVTWSAGIELTYHV